MFYSCLWLGRYNIACCCRRELYKNYSSRLCNIVSYGTFFYNLWRSKTTVVLQFVKSSLFFTGNASKEKKIIIKGMLYILWSSVVTELSLIIRLSLNLLLKLTCIEQCGYSFLLYIWKQWKPLMGFSNYQMTGIDGLWDWCSYHLAIPQPLHENLKIIEKMKCI